MEYKTEITNKEAAKGAKNIKMLCGGLYSVIARSIDGTSNSHPPNNKHLNNNTELR